LRPPASAHDRQSSGTADQLEQPATADGLTASVETPRRDCIHAEHHTKRGGRWVRYSETTANSYQLLGE
jgi:hypothetical protein